MSYYDLIIYDDILVLLIDISIFIFLLNAIVHLILYLLMSRCYGHTWTHVRRRSRK